MVIRSPFELALAANYRVHGVLATVYVGGFPYTIRCIDKTDGVALSVNGAIEVDTVSPAVSILLSSLTELGFAPIDLFKARVTINSNNWEVLTHLTRPSPMGGGEVYFTLRKLTSTELTGDTGYFVLTGQAIATRLRVPADDGIFALSMQDFSMALGQNITAEFGGFDLTGQDVFTHINVAEGYGAFTLSGQNASLRHSMPTGAGYFVLSPQTAFTHLNIQAGYGAFGLSGQTADIILPGELPPITLEYGSFVATWQAVTLRMNLVAQVGAFALTGQAVALHHTLPAEYGDFLLSGQDISFSLSLGIPADYGTFALTGQSVALRHTLPAGYGAFSLSGQDISFSLSIHIPADYGTFALTGQGVAFQQNLPTWQGSFSLTGQSVAFHQNLPTWQGSFSLTGQSVAFHQNLPTGQGSFSLTGQTTDLYRFGRYGYAFGGSLYNTIDRFPLSSGGNASDVGDLNSARYLTGIASSVTYAHCGGGKTDIAAISSYVRMSFTSPGNTVATGYGLSAAKYGVTGGMSANYGYFGGGTNFEDTTRYNTIDRITFSSLANASDIGDLTSAIFAAGSFSSLWAFYVGGGLSAASVLQKMVFASEGNSSSIGSLAVARYLPSGVYAGLYGYGYFGGGYGSGYLKDTIDRVSVVSDGDATDIANLSAACYGDASSYNGAYGYWAGDGSNPHIDRVAFASMGDATDQGDLTVSRSYCTGTQG
jgi:hypothetical protein